MASETITIPQAHIEFAETVAELAEAAGIQEFTLEYDPYHSSREKKIGRLTMDRARILFSTKGGSNRLGHRSLRIVLDSQFSHDVDSDNLAVNSNREINT